MSKLKEQMKQHPVMSFFIVSYLFSWIFWVPAILYIRINLGDQETPSWLMIPNLIGTWGPFVSAVIMARIINGKGGIKSLLAKFNSFKVGVKWYILTILIAPVGMFAAIGVYTLFHDGVGAIDHSQWIFVLLGPIPALLFGPLGEELGWRGFALPNLQKKYTALTASIIIGVVWALWHLPAYWAPSGTAISGYDVTLFNVVWYIVFTIGLSILHTWLNNNTKSSLFIAVLFHAMYTSGSVYALFPNITDAAFFDTLRWVIVPIYVFVAIALIIHGPKKLTKLESIE